MDIEQVPQYFVFKKFRRKSFTMECSLIQKLFHRMPLWSLTLGFDITCKPKLLKKVVSNMLSWTTLNLSVMSHGWTSLIRDCTKAVAHPRFGKGGRATTGGFGVKPPAANKILWFSHKKHSILAHFYRKRACNECNY